MSSNIAAADMEKGGTVHGIDGAGHFSLKPLQQVNVAQQTEDAEDDQVTRNDIV